MERELKMLQDEYDKACGKVKSAFGQMTMAEDNLVRAICEELNAKAQLDKANVEWKQENDERELLRAELDLARAQLDFVRRSSGRLREQVELEKAKARAALVERDEARQERDMTWDANPRGI
jgi:uncharacterized protein YjbJ (UPF0337 family)